MRGIFVLIAVLALIGYVSAADNITLNYVRLLNSSGGDAGGFTTDNIEEIERMLLNFTVYPAQNRTITSVYLNYTAGGANGCALGNKQESQC